MSKILSHAKPKSPNLWLICLVITLQYQHVSSTDANITACCNNPLVFDNDKFLDSKACDPNTKCLSDVTHIRNLECDYDQIISSQKSFHEAFKKVNNMIITGGFYISNVKDCIVGSSVETIVAKNFPVIFVEKSTISKRSFRNLRQIIPYNLAHFCSLKSLGKLKLFETDNRDVDILTPDFDKYLINSINCSTESVPATVEYDPGRPYFDVLNHFTYGLGGLTALYAFGIVVWMTMFRAKPQEKDIRGALTNMFKKKKGKKQRQKRQKGQKHQQQQQGQEQQQQQQGQEQQQQPQQQGQQQQQQQQGQEQQQHQPHQQGQQQQSQKEQQQPGAPQQPENPQEPPQKSQQQKSSENSEKPRTGAGFDNEDKRKNGPVRSPAVEQNATVQIDLDNDDEIEKRAKEIRALIPSTKRIIGVKHHEKLKKIEEQFDDEERKFECRLCPESQDAIRESDTQLKELKELSLELRQSIRRHEMKKNIRTLNLSQLEGLSGRG